MAVGSPRRARRTEARRRRSQGEGSTTGVATRACAVAGCPEQALTECSRCQRLVCQRHGGVPRLAGRSRATGVAGRRAPSRCALCRLADRHRRQSTVRRLWWGISAGAFAVLVGMVIRSNVRQGVALLLLALVIVITAFFYDRMLRRR